MTQFPILLFISAPVWMSIVAFLMYRSNNEWAIRLSNIFVTGAIMSACATAFLVLAMASGGAEAATSVWQWLWSTTGLIIWGVSLAGVLTEIVSQASESKAEVKVLNPIFWAIGWVLLFFVLFAVWSAFAWLWNILWQLVVALAR